MPPLFFPSFHSDPASSMSKPNPILPLQPPGRVLMAPGPSCVHPRVYEALSRKLDGHLDPEFLKVMDETQEMLRQVFCTKNPLTISISGTGSAGMEGAFVNMVEP